MYDGSLNIADVTAAARRSFSRRNLSGRSGQVPQPWTSCSAKAAPVTGVSGTMRRTSEQFRKAVLTYGWIRPNASGSAAEHHDLKGKYFDVFARQIGIDRSSAYELLKLHPIASR